MVQRKLSWSHERISTPFHKISQGYPSEIWQHVGKLVVNLNFPKTVRLFSLTRGDVFASCILGSTWHRAWPTTPQIPCWWTGWSPCDLPLRRRFGSTYSQLQEVSANKPFGFWDCAIKFGVLFCWFVCLFGILIGWIPCFFFNGFWWSFHGFWWLFHGCWWFSHGFHVCLMDFWWFSRGFSWFGCPWPSAFKGRCDSPRTQRILA